MQVYRGMDIGTAKPSAAERAEVPHHGIDLAEPSEEVTVVRYQAEARAALAAIESRGGQAILVGGTGLYLRALVDRLDPPGEWPAIRAELELDPDTSHLHARLAALDPVAAARMQPTNRRRVLRALEVTLGSGQAFSSFGPGLESYPASEVVQVGLRWPRAELTARIEQRFARQLDDGFLAEVEGLASRPAGLSRTARQALGYRELLDHLSGRTSLDEAVHLAITRTRQFAVRQDRWFRRDPRIRWIDATDDPIAALDLMEQELASCA
jgi:tRNA dimethylallyltransferase